MASTNKRALGKGLSSIISTSTTPTSDMEKVITSDFERVIEIEIETIKPNPDQPRTHFNESEINGLADSIKAVGLIQPIIVRNLEGDYVVVAGERRLRASKKAGLQKIKAIVIQANEEKNLTLALIENIQRTDLNPIEEAKSYRMLIERFRIKHQDLASKVGKERTTITNALRLLNLPDEIQHSIIDGKIGSGHAKVLLSVTEKERQLFLHEQIIDKGLSVRALESLLSDSTTEDTAAKSQKAKKNYKNSHIKEIEQKLISKLGTKVEIKHNGGKGKIEIRYYSLDDFDRIMDLIR